MDAVAVQSGSQMNVTIRWPNASGRMIGAETRRIDIAITGAGITTPPTGSIVFPETQAELAAPAGPDRYFRFTEFDANGNLVKQSYVRIGTISASGSANGNGATAQYGPYFLDDQYFGDNNTPGTAAALPTDGSLSQLQVLDNINNIDLSTTGPKYDYEDWYYFDVPNGPRQYVTLKLTGIEQFKAIAQYLSFGVCVTDPVLGTLPVAVNFPVGADDILVNGQAPLSGIMLNDEPTSFMTSSPPGSLVLEGLLPQERYFVRVCFTDGQSNAFALQPSVMDPSTLGYRLSVQFSAPAGTGGVTG